MKEKTKRQNIEIPSLYHADCQLFTHALGLRKDLNIQISSAGNLSFIAWL